jgi:hypothetical protein
MPLPTWSAWSVVALVAIGAVCLDRIGKLPAPSRNEGRRVNTPTPFGMWVAEESSPSSCDRRIETVDSSQREQREHIPDEK